MKIGLALGSGAARGWAHIGIIQALETLGIKVDVVAGCSIGAYVGAAYVSDKLPALAEWANGLTEWQVLALMGVGFHKGGLVSGQRVFQALEDNFTLPSFDQLHKPLAVVATDLYSGKEVSFTSGSVSQAVRASCAIPALFPPHPHEGRWLVDGAVVNPVPVNLCRQLGADFVFAVNLNSDFRPQVSEVEMHTHEKSQQRTNDFFKRSHALMQQWFKGADKSPAPTTNDNITVADKPQDNNAPSIIGVMSGALDILQARVTRSRLAGDPPEVLIEPQLRDFGIMEFYRATELMQEGRKSVERVAEQIKYQLRIR